MKNISGLLLAGIFGFSMNFSKGQVACTNPQPPVLNFVSVNPGSGQTELQWTKSSSPQVVAYIIHKYRNGIRTPVDTIWNPEAVGYSYKDIETKYYSLSYVVSALRLPDCESPLSNSISTIFLSASLDSCNRRIDLKWNSYTDVPAKVTGYELSASSDESSITYNAGQSTQLSISDFAVGTEYLFSVSALLEGGKRSSSGYDTLFAGMTRPPDWINADFATVNDDGKISISFTIDTRSEINRYRLERREGYTGAFQQIADLQSTNGKIIYTDEKASAERINFYRLSAINFCNLPVTISNLSSNISLSLVQDITNISLMWNHYRQWRGSVSGYRVFFDPGDGYRELALVNDTMYTFPYSGIMNQVNGDNICFRVEANEASNPYVPAGESLSSSKCLAAVEVITVPNLFTPDGDAINDYFKPVLSFIPVKYQLLITDIRGKKVFETHNYDETWDGTFKGDLLPADVYLWFVKITGPSGKNFTKNGTVTIFRHH